MSNAGRDMKQVSQASAAYYISRFLAGNTVETVVDGLIFHGASFGRDNLNLIGSYTNEYPTHEDQQRAGEALVMDALFGKSTLPSAFVEIFKNAAIFGAYNMDKQNKEREAAKA